MVSWGGFGRAGCGAVGGDASGSSQCAGSSQHAATVCWEPGWAARAALLSFAAQGGCNR